MFSMKSSFIYFTCNKIITANSSNRFASKIAKVSAGNNLSKFVDKINIRVSGGKGGDGCVSYECHDGPTSKRPSGGHGGAGGDVYIVADCHYRSLNFEQHHYNAGNGGNGGAARRKGRRGEDRILKVPCGTIVREIPQKEDFLWKGWFSEDKIEILDKNSENECGHNFNEIASNRKLRLVSDELKGDENLIEEEIPLMEIDLNKDQEKVLLVKGGNPGLGNQIMAGSRKHRSMSPKKLPGAHGQSKEFSFELKTIADVGLVGYPNAGKSTLLGAMSRAKPKTASYTFTTLHPTVGHLEYSDSRQITMADIPGLIEGAHENRGLGHEFLRHIERTKVLIYIVDISGSEGRDPCQDFKSLRNELVLYNQNIILKPSLVVANKIDEEGADGNLQRLIKAARPLKVYATCAFFGEGIEDVAVDLREMVEVAEKYQDLKLILQKLNS